MVMKKTFIVFIFGIIAGFQISCRQGVTDESIQIAMTYVAETQAVRSPTPAPMQTSQPQPTATTPRLSATTPRLSATTPRLSATVAPAASPTPSPDTAPSASDVNWEEAHFYYGESVTVCGPVVGTYYASDSNGKPTFLNVGEDYPSQDRFVVVIWGDNRDEFPDDPENYYYGKTICVTGEVEEYEGLYQIEAEGPADIEVE